MSIVAKKSQAKKTTLAEPKRLKLSAKKPEQDVEVEEATEFEPFDSVLQERDETIPLDELSANKHSQPTESPSTSKLSMLHFKQLRVGAKVMAVVKEVTKRDVALALPSWLTAYAQVADPTLYTVGQVVLGTLTKVGTTVDGRHKRLEMDICDSRLYNHGQDVRAEELVPGMALMGKAGSREATGYNVDLGLNGLLGFFQTSSSMELRSTTTWSIKAVKGRVVLVEPFEVAAMVTSKDLLRGDDISDRSLLAGMMFPSVPKALHAKALFDGPSEADKPVRLVYSDPSTDVFLFSQAKHLVAPTAVGDLPFKVGSLVEAATYVGSYGKSGALFRLLKHRSDVTGFASRVHLDADVKLRLGGAYVARVTGYDVFSRAFRLSLTEEDLAAAPMADHTDVVVGSTPKAAIIKGSVAEGYTLRLLKAPNVRTYVPPTECANKALLPNDVVRCLVLENDGKSVIASIDADLINKRTLVPCEWSQFEMGKAVCGRVVTVTTDYALVKFAGGIKGVLLKGDITATAFVKDAREHVALNAILACRVLSVDVVAKRLQLTLREDRFSSPTSSSKKNDKKEKRTDKKGESKSESKMEEPSKEEAPKKELPKVSPLEALVKPSESKKRSLDDYEEAEEELEEPRPQANVDASPMVGKDVREEFERRLLTEPNSAVAWIEYAGALVRLGDLAQARLVCERALATISHREDAQRRAVWIAYLNLEWTYQQQEDDTPSKADTNKTHKTLLEILKGRSKLVEVFARATAQCDDPLEVTLALGSVVAESDPVVGETFFRLYVVRKHRGEPKAWLAYLTLLRTAKSSVSSSENVMEEALRALPKREHVAFTEQVALMEYRTGSGKSRGRLLFEGLVCSYPRRLDVWLVYIAQEIKLLHGQHDDIADLSQVRSIFERLLSTAATSLSTKKAKTVFKEYLDFEKRFGTVSTVEHVKELARAYVDSKTGQQEDD